jgi:hypothetical protein
VGRPKKKEGGTQKPKSKPEFRTRVDPELVDTLLYRFVFLVKQGLELMLTDPSELAREEFDKAPELHYSAEDIPISLAWVTQEAYELEWPTFCQFILSHAEWCALLSFQDQAGLDQLAAGFRRVQLRLVELAVHDGLKAGDKADTRPEGQQSQVQAEYNEFIGVSRVLKMLKKRLRAFLKRLDEPDLPHPAHRPRADRSRSFLLADLLRWLLHLNSTDEMIRRLKQFPILAGAVNFQPGEIPSKATFSRRRSLLSLDDLKAILHELVEVLIRLKVLEGRAWLVDLTRIPTYSSVSKAYPDRPNGKSDPEATFCGYPDNDNGLQFGYSLLFVVDFKTELPFAFCFAGGSVQDSPLAVPLLEEAGTLHPLLAQACQFVLGDGGYDAVQIFEFILNQLHALPAITKNPRRAKDPQADLTTDTLCVLRRRSPEYQALFHSRTGVERTNSRIKLNFNLRYQKQRGWEAVNRCALFALIAMLSAAWVAVKTGHPDKIRASWTWISPT